MENLTQLYSEQTTQVAQGIWTAWQEEQQSNPKARLKKFMDQFLLDAPELKGPIQAVAILGDSGVGLEDTLAHAVAVLKLVKLDRNWAVAENEHDVENVYTAVAFAAAEGDSSVHIDGVQYTAKGERWAVADTKALVKQLAPAPEKEPNPPVEIDLEALVERVSFDDAPATVAADVILDVTNTLGLVEGEHYVVV